MTFVEVKFECINWWGNEVYRTKKCGDLKAKIVINTNLYGR